MNVEVTLQRINTQATEEYQRALAYPQRRTPADALFLAWVIEEVERVIPTKGDATFGCSSTDLYGYARLIEIGNAVTRAREFPWRHNPKVQDFGTYLLTPNIYIKKLKSEIIRYYYCSQMSIVL